MLPSGLKHLCQTETDPKGIAESGNVRSLVSEERCKKLADYEMVQHLDGVYHIGEKGEQYLVGELDARKLESDAE